MARRNARRLVKKQKQQKNSPSQKPLPSEEKPVDTNFPERVAVAEPRVVEQKKEEKIEEMAEEPSVKTAPARLAEEAVEGVRVRPFHSLPILSLPTLSPLAPRETRSEESLIVPPWLWEVSEREMEVVSSLLSAISSELFIPRRLIIDNDEEQSLTTSATSIAPSSDSNCGRCHSISSFSATTDSSAESPACSSTDSWTSMGSLVDSPLPSSPVTAPASTLHGVADLSLSGVTPSDHRLRLLSISRRLESSIVSLFLLNQEIKSML